MRSLNISINSEVLKDVSMKQDPTIAAIKKYKWHTSILKIRKNLSVETYFDFKHIDDKKMSRGTKRFKCKKG